MRDVCMEALHICETYFRAAEANIPPAQWVPWEGTHNWRFIEKLPQQALVAKLARQITGLKCADTLLSLGYLQEVGLIFRVLDEISEDISYVSLAIVHSSWTDKHDDYLNYFWSEGQIDGPPPVKRKVIRAFVHRCGGLDDPSTADQMARQIHQTYSDYIHARSEPIMAMVCGPPPAFDLDGIRDTEARWAYSEQMPSYFYRALVSTFMVTKVASPHFSESCHASIKDWEHKNSRLIMPLG